MSRKFIPRLKAAVQQILASIRRAEERTARVQEEINAARNKFYQKYPETFIRRGLQ